MRTVSRIDWLLWRIHEYTVYRVQEKSAEYELARQAEALGLVEMRLHQPGLWELSIVPNKVRFS